MITPLPRLGDLSAQPMYSLPGARIWMVVTVAADVCFSCLLLATLIARGDLGRIVGACIGVAVSAAIAAGLLAWWARYWRPVRVALADLAQRHPDAVVIAARLPAVPTTTVEQTWAPGSPRLHPQEGALVADERGLSFYSARDGVAAPLLVVPWSELRDLSPVEFVEGRIAYQGLLLTGHDPESRLVFQAACPHGSLRRSRRATACARCATGSCGRNIRKARHEERPPMVIPARGRGIRPINEDELRLIELILRRSDSPVAPPAAGSLVRPLDDGGMGSLSLDIDGVEKFGEVVGEVGFRDSDGVGVSAALYLDSHGRLYELDVFKGDFSALRRWPTEVDCGRGSSCRAAFPTVGPRPY